MYFKHHPDIWNDFPGLQAGVIVVEDVHTEADFSAPIADYFAQAKDRLKESEEGSFPEITSWRGQFSQMGLKPTQYRCAAESILRRLRKSGDFPQFHPLVDVCNAFSAKHATPIAVIDLDHVSDGITVSYSDGSYEHLNFGDEIETPEEKEVVFLDEAGHAHSRRWCFRQSKKSVIRPDTKRAMIVAESHHEGADESLAELINTLQPLLAEYYAVQNTKFLSPEDPEIIF